jgi:hypothetical protein
MAGVPHNLLQLEVFPHLMLFLSDPKSVFCNKFCSCKTPVVNPSNPLLPKEMYNGDITVHETPSFSRSWRSLNRTRNFTHSVEL